MISSKIIIIVKPTMRRRDSISFLLFCTISGINSCMVTKIIAPAAKDIMKGSKLCIFRTRSAPTTAKIGSTIALSDPK